MRLTGVTADELGAADAALRVLRPKITWLAITEEVVGLAEQPTPTHLKSLDAIQLATARIVRDLPMPELVFATHDRRLAAAAASFGFETAGV